MKNDKCDNFDFFISKGQYKYRWPLLSVCIWVVAGAYYCFDHPAALHNSLKTHFQGKVDGNLFELYFSLLYSLYSLANIFLPFISGKLRDRIGDRIVLFLMGCLIIIGQAIFSYGVYLRNFFIMIFGRIILGWGIESILPTQTAFISPYFRDDYLAFAVGCNEFFATSGSILCMYYCPLLAQRYGIVFAVSTGVFFNIFSCVCSIICIYIDKHAERQLKIQRIEHDGIEQEYLREEEKQNDEIQSQRNLILSAFDTTEMKQFLTIFWYMALYCSLVITSALGFVNVSVGLMTERWYPDDDNAEETIGTLIALMWIITGLLTPIFGFIIDIVHNRSIFNIFGSILCILGQLMIWYYLPFVGCIFLGTAYALTFASVWTSVIFVINPIQYGKAYGCLIALQNLFFSIIPFLIGILRWQTENYFLGQMLLVFVGFVSFIFAIFVYIEDRKLGYLIDGQQFHQNID